MEKPNPTKKSTLEELKKAKGKSGVGVRSSRGVSVTLEEERMIREAFVIKGWKISHIARILKREHKAVSHIIQKRKWKALRDRLDRKLVEKAFKANEKEFQTIVGLGTEVIARFLKQVISDPGEISFKDAKLTSDMVANYHRIKQITEGKPNQITQVQHLSEDQYRQEMEKLFDDMKKDPMMDLDKIDIELIAKGDIH